MFFEKKLQKGHLITGNTSSCEDWCFTALSVWSGTQIWPRQKDEKLKAFDTRRAYETPFLRFRYNSINLFQQRTKSVLSGVRCYGVIYLWSGVRRTKTRARDIQGFAQAQVPFNLLAYNHSSRHNHKKNITIRRHCLYRRDPVYLQANRD